MRDVTALVVLVLATAHYAAAFVDKDGIDAAHKCDLCPCYQTYTNRDIWSPQQPASVATNGYETTLDQCLALCIEDQECLAIVYGYVGGREITTCELYHDIDLPGGVRYTYGINTYALRTAMPCLIDYEHVFDPDGERPSVRPPGESIQQRKRVNMRLSRLRNPLFGLRP